MYENYFLSRKTSNYFVDILKFFFCLIPLSIVLGPAVSDWVISLMGIIFIIYTIWNKNYDIYLNKFYILFVIWCLYLIINSLFSENVLHSLESSLFYFRFGFITLVSLYLLEFDKNFARFFLFSLSFILIFLSIDSFTQFFFGYNFFGFELNETRLTGIFHKEEKLGSFVSRISPLFLALVFLIYKNNKYIIVISILFYFVLFILVFLTGERSAFFYSIITFIAMLIFTKNFFFYKIITLFLSFIVIYFIVVNNYEIKYRMFVKTISQFDKIDPSYNKIFNDTFGFDSKILNFNFFSIEHQLHYASAIEMFNDKKIIGHGPKMFRILCKEDKYYFQLSPAINNCSTHPHNTYIQLLAETGLVGFFSIFILFFFTIIILFKKFFYVLTFSKFQYLNEYQSFLFTSVFITLWPIVPTGNFFNNWLSVMYFLPTGFIIYEFKNRLITK